MNTQIQTKLRKKLSLAKVRKAFSLVELLVVIAVIGIIAAIAIPNISGITANANVAKDQRNAQQIASVYASAVAAGADAIGTTNGPQTKAAAITLITGAGMSNNAATNPMTFSVPNLVVDSSKDKVSTYLSPTLTYDPSGTQTP